MKQLKNYSAQEVEDTINIVVDRVAGKFKRPDAGYELEDVKQEAWVICIEALERYDEERPLENFLAYNLSNRMLNFLRDKTDHTKNEDKKRVIKPVQLENELNILDRQEDDSENRFFLEELKSLVNRHMPASLRMDYLKYVNEVSIPSSKKKEIEDFLMYIHETYYEPRDESDDGDE